MRRDSLLAAALGAVAAGALLLGLGLLLASALLPARPVLRCTTPVDLSAAGTHSLRWELDRWSSERGDLVLRVAFDEMHGPGARWSELVEETPLELTFESDPQSAMRWRPYRGSEWPLRVSDRSSFWSRLGVKVARASAANQEVAGGIEVRLAVAVGDPELSSSIAYVELFGADDPDLAELEFVYGLAGGLLVIVGLLSGGLWLASSAGPEE